MLYCEKCRCAFDGDRCPECGGKKRIREIRDDDLCLLTERDMIWSEVTEDFLRQNDIPFLVKGRMGAGLAINVGPMFEKNRYYVPYAYLEKARDVIEAVFAEADMETDVSPDDGEEG